MQFLREIIKFTAWIVINGMWLKYLLYLLLSYEDYITILF